MKVYVLTDDVHEMLTVAESRRACVEYLVEYHYISPFDEEWDDQDERWKPIHEFMYENPDMITFNELVDWIVDNWKMFNEYFYIEEANVRKEYEL